jgi:hypothetical protein
MKGVRYALALAVGLTSGCSMNVSPFGPTMSAWTSVVGHIDSTGTGMSPLVVPDTVQAGASFDATVVTFGSRGCFRPGETELVTAPDGVDITPFDSARIAARRCLPGLTPASRVVTLRFDQPGAAMIRLRGRGFHGFLVLERTIVVR